MPTDEQARQKEAKRTIQRIRSTLNRLQDGSAWDQPLEESEEFKRMQQLLESGYGQPRRKFSRWTSTLFRRPLAWLSLLVIVVIILEWLQR